VAFVSNFHDRGIYFPLYFLFGLCFSLWTSHIESLFRLVVISYLFIAILCCGGIFGHIHPPPVLPSFQRHLPSLLLVFETILPFDFYAMDFFFLWSCSVGLRDGSFPKYPNPHATKLTLSVLPGLSSTPRHFSPYFLTFRSIYIPSCFANYLPYPPYNLSLVAVVYIRDFGSLFIDWLRLS